VSGDVFFEVVSPIDGRVVRKHGYASDAQIAAALDQATRASAEWRRAPLEQRLAQLEAFVSAVEKQHRTIAETICWSIGRPLAQADETGLFCSGARHLIEVAREALTVRSLADRNDGARRFVMREPLGVTFAICAWNYPLTLCVASLIPALAAGNPVILKHAPQTAAIGDILAAAAAAHLPTGVCQHVFMTHDQAARVVADDRVRLVSFVGSERGGRAVHAAAAGSFKHFTLELGGKDAVYVRADVDCDAAARSIASGAFANSGQSCCSVERVYVARPIAGRFLEALAACARSTTLGHPAQDSPDIGPLVSDEAALRVRNAVNAALTGNAELLCGYPRQELTKFPTGAYVSPIVMANVDQRCALMQDETFGPVVAVNTVRSDAEAIDRMNDSRYGLTASVYSQDIDRAIEIGRSLDVGSVTINECNFPDAHLPWGGVKASGIGRTDGDLAYEAVTQWKSFYASVARG
jgi:acyl-CoA reductase-like NAD-dependent aldehyde dehydrogenase